MNNLKQLLNITGRTLFVIILIFFSTSQAKNPDKFEKSNNISNYFSVILLFNENQYEKSFEFLKKLEGLENTHFIYSSKYLYSLINSGNLNKAFNYAKKLEKDQRDIFESDLVIGVYFLKNLKFELSKKYFLKAKKRKSRSFLENYLADSLYLLSNLNSYELEKSINYLENFDRRFENLNKIQKVFLNCFYNSSNTENLFENLVSDKKTDFSRYNYFYAKYLDSIGKNKKSKKIIDNALKSYPRNLLLNTYKFDEVTLKNNSNFDCKKQDNVSGEIIYIAANALSSQNIYSLSNFYLNLAKYLNEDFHSYDTLLAENFYKINEYTKAKKIYEKLSRIGDSLKWYSSKQISRILIVEDEKEKSLKLFRRAYNELGLKGIYETFDYAEFLKNNEEFDESIKYYSRILDQINRNHPLFPEVTDGRGIAYERTGQWDKAEKDLLSSLEASPDQAYVINYLAYSWIEKGININKSLNMLERANELKKNDPYIIDSLGWALFKLKRFKESKDYLQLAVRLMPADPIVNDHYGDVLWKSGEKIQARYYWKYVLNLEKTEKDLKEIIKKKLIKGL